VLGALEEAAVELPRVLELLLVHLEVDVRLCVPQAQRKRECVCVCVCVSSVVVPSRQSRACRAPAARWRARRSRAPSCAPRG
jgi:hypothetical protein